MAAWKDSGHGSPETSRQRKNRDKFWSGRTRDKETVLGKNSQTDHHLRNSEKTGTNPCFLKVGFGECWQHNRNLFCKPGLGGILANFPRLQITHRTCLPWTSTRNLNFEDRTSQLPALLAHDLPSPFLPLTLKERTTSNTWGKSSSYFIYPGSTHLFSHGKKKDFTFSLLERVDLRSQKGGFWGRNCLGKGGVDRAKKGKKDAQKKVGQ